MDPLTEDAAGAPRKFLAAASQGKFVKIRLYRHRK